MTNSQKEYWKRQQEAGKKKITIVISKDAQNILSQKKNLSKTNYSMIVEEALLCQLDKETQETVISKKITDLENQLKNISVNISEYDQKLQKISKDFTRKITGNDKKLSNLEKRLPKLRKKTTR